MKWNEKIAVLVASMCINLFVGMLYAWSVFAGPLGDKFGWSGTATALAFTIANGISPVTMITGGKLLDKFGPRWVVFIGGLLFGGGMITSGFVRSLMGIYVAYGIFVGFGMGMVYSCTISNTVKFFPEKKGLVAGLATGSYGMSTVILAPIAQELIDGMGIMTTFRILGTTSILVICIGALFLRKAPQQEKVDAGKGMDWKQMLRTGRFYALLSMLVFGATAGLMMIGQASQMARALAGFSAGQAALCVSGLALANAGGRVVWGMISDRFGYFKSLFILFFLLTIAMGALFLQGNGSVVVFIGALFIIGSCFGGLMGIFPAITAGQFGIKHNGTNYGIMFCGFAIGGFLGPYVAATLQETALGLYSMAFLVAGALSLIGCVLALLLRRLLG